MTLDTDKRSSKFYTSVCEMLDHIDGFSHIQYSYVLRDSFSDLFDSMNELNTYSIFAVRHHLLLDKASTKRLCSVYWLQQTGWRPFKNIQCNTDFK